MDQQLSIKAKFIKKWKHGASDEEVEQAGGDPLMVAQRLVNLYNCFQMMNETEQAEYISELKKTPETIRKFFLRIIGGKEIAAFCRYLDNGTISPLALENLEASEEKPKEKPSIGLLQRKAPPAEGQAGEAPPPPPVEF